MTISTDAAADVGTPAARPHQPSVHPAADRPPVADTERATPWPHARPDHPVQLLTHHALMLLAAAQRPDARIRELADAVGVTPRTAVNLLQDLERSGCLHRVRRGRRNHYTVHLDCPVVDPGSGMRTVRAFLTAFGRAGEDGGDRGW